MDHRARQRHDNKPSQKRAKVHNPCYSGVSGAIFTLTFICLSVAMYLMEGPIRFLNVIYVLYVLIIAVFVFQILLDLGIWDGTKSGSFWTRHFMSKLCPVLCLGLSVPPAGLLWHTKNRGGFKSSTADISLIFSLLVIVAEVLHFLLTLYVYRKPRNADSTSVRFTYAENSSLGYPSPASSIRSGRIDFINNRTRGSLASIDPAFIAGYPHTTMHSQRGADVVDVNRRFWNEQGIPADQASHFGYQFQHSAPHRQHRRRNSETSIVSDASSIVSQSSAFSSVSKRSSSKRSTGSKDDTHSIVSRGSKKSGSRGSRRDQGIRVEEEMTYNPVYFLPAMSWR